MTKKESYTWKLLSLNPGFLAIVLTQTWHGIMSLLILRNMVVKFSIPANLSFQLAFSNCVNISAPNSSVAFSRTASSCKGKETLKIKAGILIRPPDFCHKLKQELKSIFSNAACFEDSFLSTMQTLKSEAILVTYFRILRWFQHLPHNQCPGYLTRYYRFLHKCLTTYPTWSVLLITKN